MADYSKELEVAVKAVRLASRLCRNVQRQIGSAVLEKNDKSPVTVADFGSQALVCDALGRAFPDDPVIGEENADALRTDEVANLRARLVDEVCKEVPSATESGMLDAIDRGGQQTYCDRFWTLDPIDGTKGFLRGDQYAISLALVVEGKIQVAVLGCPNLSDQSGVSGLLLSAVRGDGTRGTALFEERDVWVASVSKVTDLKDVRTCESFEKAHSAHGDLARIRQALGFEAKPVRIDSQAKYAAVAKGDAEIYLRLPRDGVYREKIWDHAGGVLVVEEAGGQVTDIFGKPLCFTHGRTLAENRGVVVSNGPNHQQVIDTIARLQIGRF